MIQKLIPLLGFLATALIAAEPVTVQRGLVVSSHALASQAGVQILRQGGNAVDAAIATGLALAVTHPSAGNIGGGGFMIVFTKAGEVTTFDFREKAPAAAHERMFLGENGEYLRDSNHEGYRSVGVPGTVAGFDLARQRFGSMPWKELAAPAVALARDGFQLSPAQAEAFARLKKDWSRHPSSAKVFLARDGSTLPSGHVWKQADLAQSLVRIQSDGRDGFYRGETARAIASDMKMNGGLITEADLASYQARERKPIRGSYRGFEVYSMPPPSSGGVALVEALNILEGFRLKSLGHNSAPYLHLVAESMRRAFADRARHLGDPDFNPEMPVSTLTSKEHAARLRASINTAQASKSSPERFAEAFESPETTHYSVVDAEGTAVVVTYTLEYSYGSRIVAEGLGFLYNNEMGDFNPQPGRTDGTGLIGTSPNRVAPGKRMLSSMTPTIIANDGKPCLLIGSPGGRTIINTVLQIVLNVIDFDMDLGAAITAGRIHHQWLPDQIQMERDKFRPEILAQLREVGHSVVESARQGEAMGIHIDPKSSARTGFADPRSPDGAAVGY